jgi:peptidoglycan/xylan/chitin deacetylase (PgdA/CDA1 family)
MALFTIIRTSVQRALKRAVITGGLETAAVAARLGVRLRARGAIFTLHHVRPKTEQGFDPNAHLDITPDFLADAIDRLRQEGFDFVRLDEVPALLADGNRRKPFAAFTLDDGYRDNAQYALPVFEDADVPLTVFVTKGFAERRQTIWWETAAAMLQYADRLQFDFGKGREKLEIRTTAGKMAAFKRLEDAAFLENEATFVRKIDQAARALNVHPQSIVHDETMDAYELRRFAAHPLVSLGAHTVTHPALALLDEETARGEMIESADYVEKITGIRPTSIAYPYGFAKAVSAREHRLAAEAGFSLAVTTSPGLLRGKGRDNLFALSRISLNGHYQKPRYVSALASGLPFLI